MIDVLPQTKRTGIEAACEYLRRALAALESGHLDDALEAVKLGRIVIDTELQFRAARRGEA